MGQPGYYQPQYAQPQYGQPSYAQRPSNGVAVAGGVVGIVSLVLAFIPFIDFLSIPGAIVAIVLGAIGVQHANRMGGTSKGMAITGIVTGIIALLIVIVFLGLVYSAIYFHVRTDTFPSFTPFPT